MQNILYFLLLLFSVTASHPVIPQHSQNVGAFIESVGELINNIKEGPLVGVISRTLENAVDCGIISQETGKRIEDNFILDVFFNGQASLTLEEIGSFNIHADSIDASEFRHDLQFILESKNSGAPRARVLTLLKNAINLLLANNIKKCGDGILTETAKSAKAVITFVRAVEPKIVQLAQDAPKAIAEFRLTLQTQATAAVKTSSDLLEKALKSTVNAAVAVGAFDRNTGQTLLSIFAENGGPIDMTSLTAISMAVNNEKFMVTLKRLIELKWNGAEPMILLGGMEASILTLMADKALLSVSKISPLLNILGLSNIMLSIESAKQITGIVQDHIPVVVGNVQQRVKMLNQFASQYGLKRK